MSPLGEVAVRPAALVPRTRPAPPRLAPPDRGWLRELLTPAPLHLPAPRGSGSTR